MPASALYILDLKGKVREKVYSFFETQASFAEAWKVYCSESFRANVDMVFYYCFFRPFLACFLFNALFVGQHFLTVVWVLVRLCVCVC